MHNLHAGTHPWASQFTDQGCECVERSLNEEDDCECDQNDDGSFESNRQQINLCMNCPQLAPQLYPGPPRQRLPKEYPSSSGNHRDLRLGQNDSDADYGDCDNQIDDNDEDDCDDHSNDNDDDDEDSDINMEVDDDFRKFLEQSEKHRQEREQSKLTSIEPFFDAHGNINVHDCIIVKSKCK